jgi:hypothetical protein
MRWYRHLGSDIALVIGCLSFVAGITQPSGGGSAIGGAAMVLGSLAYRSAKSRRLGEVASTPTRRISEMMMVGAIFPIVLLQSDLKYILATDPVPNAIIPVWAIIAYALVAFWPTDNERRA